MGRRIAMMWEAADFNVILCVKQISNHDLAFEYINSSKDKQAAKLGTKPGTVKFTTLMQDAAEKAWVVIESVPEVLKMKIDILGQVDALAPAKLHHRDELVVTTLESHARQHEKELPHL